MKFLVLLFASLACASAQVFSVESGLYTPEWIQDQAFDDLDVYYEEAFQDDFYPDEYPDGVGELEGGPPVPEPPAKDFPQQPGPQFGGGPPVPEPPAKDFSQRPGPQFVPTPGCVIDDGQNPFCKPGLNCSGKTHPICNGWLIESCLYRSQPRRFCARLARL